MPEIFQAKSIVTMNAALPRATHVLVSKGHVLGVGTEDDASLWQAEWSETLINNVFANKVILPGFVEGHSHMMEGLFWNYAYVGYYDREGPDGTIWPGLKSIEAVADRLNHLQAARDDKSAPLIAWGFDPIFFKTRRMNLGDLDAVSTACPIIVLHASLHILNTNSFVVEKAGVSPGDNSEAIRRDAAGQPTGEFLGQLGMYMAMRVTGLNLLAAAGEPQTLYNFADVARQVGVTTATDLANPLLEEAVNTLTNVTGRDDFPCRLVVVLQGGGPKAVDGIRRISELANRQTDKLRFSAVKLIADGSIQGFSARLKPPGYHNGAENGLWYIEPARLAALIDSYNEAKIQIHIHTNGDACTEVALDAIEAALRKNPWRGHRHTLQHCQMADRAQFKRMRALGVGVNLFSNHIYYWGDAHIATTIGPERAAHLDNAGGALAEGVPVAIHSDAPVTALSPLFTAWCAVNRITSSGARLGTQAYCLTVDQALKAITLGAAYSLKMDHEIGSIEVGKRADFAILDEDPYEVAPMRLKDIRVTGTVIGGHVHLNSRPESTESENKKS